MIVGKVQRHVEKGKGTLTFVDPQPCGMYCPPPLFYKQEMNSEYYVNDAHKVQGVLSPLEPQGSASCQAGAACA